ncbi:hypothetical protein ACE6H2_015366 [Prunus campanulata]
MENEVIPPKIQVVLEYYEDFMLDKLFGSLPPRRTIDHQMVLLPGAKALVKAPYRIAPPKIA